MSLMRRYKKQQPPPLPQKPAVPISARRLLSVKEAATYIAHSPDLVRDMVKRGEIAFVRKGDGKTRQHVLIDRADLDTWVDKNKKREVAA